MRQIALFPLVAGIAFSVASSFAAPPPQGGGRPGYSGGGHAGYRGGGAPIHRPGYGYGGWYGGGRAYPYYGLGLGLGFGLGYGAGWAYSSYPGYYWGAPYYRGYPYGYVVSTAPAAAWNDDVVYIQQSQTLSTNPQQPGTGSWYYCSAPAGYYPYVQQCSRPWMEVQPQPATPPQ